MDHLCCRLMGFNRPCVGQNDFFPLTKTLAWLEYKNVVSGPLTSKPGILAS
jgi:hypothetical protein